jgi:hypothetical protein
LIISKAHLQDTKKPPRENGTGSNPFARFALYFDRRNRADEFSEPAGNRRCGRGKDGFIYPIEYPMECCSGPYRTSLVLWIQTRMEITMAIEIRMNALGKITAAMVGAATLGLLAVSSTPAQAQVPYFGIDLGNGVGIGFGAPPSTFGFAPASPLFPLYGAPAQYLPYSYYYTR